MSLTRPEFLDRRLEPEELHNAAVLWLRWFNLAHQAVMSGMTQTPTPGAVCLEVRLWGIPRHQMEEYREALRRSLESADLAIDSVTQFDPDTLSARSHSFPQTVDPGDIPSFHPWLNVLLSDTFKGLWCELRLTAEDKQKRAAVHGNTLVFAGVLRGEVDGFRVRAIYPAGPNSESEWMFEHHEWERQGDLLRALDDTVPEPEGDDGGPGVPDWVLGIFNQPMGNSLGRALLWLVAPRKSRFSDFAFRIFLMAGVSLGSIVLAAALHENYPMLAWYGLTPIALLSGLAALFLLWFVFNRVRTVYALMSHSMERLYSNPISHPERVLDHFPGFAKDPALRKYSAELTHLGWSYFQDIGIEPAAGESYIRLYLKPEESALFALMLMRGSEEMTNYPTRHGMIVKTFFTDGTYLVSTNGHSGYRRAFQGLPAIPRVFSDVTDPAEMWQRHQKCVAVLEKQGKRRTTLIPAEIIPHLLDEHENNRAMLMKYGAFDWEAAFRMAFDLVRPEYRG